MIRKLFLLTCLGLCCLSLKAQGNLSINFGVTQTTLLPDYPVIPALSLPDIETRANWYIGLGYDMPLGDKLHINTGLEFNRAAIRTFDGLLRVKSINNWVSLPIQLGYDLLERVRIMGGFQGNYLVSSLLRGDLRSNATDGVRKLDAGPLIGMSVKVHSRIAIDFSYYHGLRDLSEPILAFLNPLDPLEVTVIDTDNYSRYVRLGIQYRL